MLTNQIRTGNGVEGEPDGSKNTDHPTEPTDGHDATKTEVNSVPNGSAVSAAAAAAAASVSAALTNPISSVAQNGAAFKFENGNSGKAPSFEPGDITSAISSFALDRFAGIV